MHAVDSAYGTESDHELAMHHLRRADEINRGDIQRDDVRFYETAVRARKSLTALLDEGAFQASVTDNQALWTNLNLSGCISNKNIEHQEGWTHFCDRCNQQARNGSTWHVDSNVNKYVEQTPLPIFLAGPT